MNKKMDEMKPPQTKILRPFPVILISVLAFIALVAFPYTEEIRSLASVKKVDDHPFYLMVYYGDYGFQDFLKTGLQPESSWRNNQEDFACTCFAALNPEGDYLFGRNFDWYDHPALLLFTHPPDGYASVSMVDISYLGFTGDTDISWTERVKLLDAAYLPFDGMNEYGLTIGLMAVPFSQPSYDPAKVTIDGLHIIRLALDYARTVNEAVELFKKYNVSFSEGIPIHYLIADASGESAVIEFDYKDVKVIRNTEPWQVSTNFSIFGVTIDQGRTKCLRYNNAYSALQALNGHVSHEDALKILNEVSQTNTIWSTLYDITTGEIMVMMDRNYDKIYKFTLKMGKD